MACRWGLGAMLIVGSVLATGAAAVAADEGTDGGFDLFIEGVPGDDVDGFDGLFDPTGSDEWYGQGGNDTVADAGCWCRSTVEISRPRAPDTSVADGPRFL